MTRARWPEPARGSGDEQMELIDMHRSVLVLVDYQLRLLPALHRADEVLAHAQRLARTAHQLGVPIVGTEQNPQRLGSSDPVLAALCTRMLEKHAFDACADGLLAALPRPRGLDGPRHVVIAGCEAHVCLLQTSLSLLAAGDRVWVVGPACGARSPEDHDLAMQRLRQAGAVVVGTEMVCFEWLRDCRHPRFKALLETIKSRRL